MELIRLTLTQKFPKGRPYESFFPSLVESEAYKAGLGRYGGLKQHGYDIVQDTVDFPDETLVYGVWYNYGWEGTELQSIYGTYMAAKAACEHEEEFVAVHFIEDMLPYNLTR